MKPCRYKVQHIGCKKHEIVQLWVSNDKDTKKDNKNIIDFAHQCHTTETESGKPCEVALNERKPKYEIITRRF